MKVCRTCAVELGRQNSSGYCRPHFNKAAATDPAFIAKRKAGLARYYADPEARAKVARRIGAYMQNMPPEERERRRNRGHWLAENVLARPDVRAAASAPEVRARAGLSRSRTTLPWCPPEYYELNRQLTAQGFKLPERKAMIAGEIERNGPVAQARRQIELYRQRERAKVAREKAQAY